VSQIDIFPGFRPPILSGPAGVSAGGEIGFRRQ